MKLCQFVAIGKRLVSDFGDPFFERDALQGFTPIKRLIIDPPDAAGDGDVLERGVSVKRPA